MGLGVRAAPFTYVAHALAVVAAAMVLYWCIHFRGGLAFEADNKNLIFNVSELIADGDILNAYEPFTPIAVVLCFPQLLTWISKDSLVRGGASELLVFPAVHPVLMLIGFIILGSEAIMVYKVLPTVNHDTTKLIHLVLHAIALVLGAVGIYRAFKNHNETGIANLYSLHSWLGIGTISLYGIQWIFGFLTFFFPKAAPDVRKGALPWHVLLGIFVYILALATAELGFLEKLTFLQSSGIDKYGPESFLVNFTALVVVLFGASVVVAAVAPARLEEPQGYAPIPEN